MHHPIGTHSLRPLATVNVFELERGYTHSQQKYTATGLALCKNIRSPAIQCIVKWGILAQG